MLNAINMKGEVVLVTGGSGFLGQHIIQLLQEKTTNLTEIRVFDVKPYSNKLEHVEPVKVTSIVGDIRNKDDVSEALRDVTSVIHTAGVVSFGRFPDLDAMESVNVTATANLIEGCIERGVSSLVFTSTIDVVIGYDNIENGDEKLKPPRKFLFPGYPDTKYRAERLVLSSNGLPLAADKGSVLRTLALRPNVMYGEFDPYFIINGLEAASNSLGGILPRVGRRDAKFQQAYVGNVAWAHVCALQALQDTSGGACAAGQAFFITDDTPVMNSFDFMEPFLNVRGLRLSEFSVPFSLVYCILFASETLFELLSPLYRVHSKTSLASLIYINMDISFSRRRAEEMLMYQPLYDYKTSLERSLHYYKDIGI